MCIPKEYNLNMKTLKEYTTEKNITPTQLSRLLGVTLGHASNLIQGHKKPSGELATKIHDLTGGLVPFQSWFTTHKTTPAGNDPQ